MAKYFKAETVARTLEVVQAVIGKTRTEIFNNKLVAPYNACVVTIERLSADKQEPKSFIIKLETAEIDIVCHFPDATTCQTCELYIEKQDILLFSGFCNRNFKRSRYMGYCWFDNNTDQHISISFDEEEECYRLVSTSTTDARQMFANIYDNQINLGD